MHFTRAAVTILFAVAAFVLPAVGTAVASQPTAAVATGTVVAPDDIPWH